MIVHLSDRKVLRVHGAGAREFLNGLLTNDLAALTDETPLWAALLSAQGKLIADMVVFQGGTGGDGREEVLLDIHQDRAEAVLTALRRYRLRQPIDIDPVELRAFAAWKEPLVVAPADPRSDELGVRWLAATANVSGSLRDYEARRMSLGIADSPDFQPDKLMWLESNADLLNGVSFTKGCFVGQENTARMNYRGKVRKRTLPVRLGGDPGAAVELVTAEGKSAGTLTNAVEGEDGWIGMALMRLEHLDTELSLGGSPVNVIRPEWLPAEAGGVAEAREEVD